MSHADRSARMRAARDERAQAMAMLYREGRTLEEIGQQYGITRERVRQLLAGIGVTRQDGGQSVTAAKTRAKRMDRLDARSLALRGMTHAEFSALPVKAKRAYLGQKRNARTRGIEWRMTLAEWWRIWSLSGKWEQRGRGAGYVMARKGDAGPYAVDNVYICTASQNIKDGYIWKPAHARVAKRGGKRYEYQGRHVTLSELAREVGVANSTLDMRLRRGMPLEQAIALPVDASRNWRARRAEAAA